MSTAKVSSTAPVRQTASTMRLNGVRAAAPALESATIETVGDSAGTRSATDQYLTDGNDAAPSLFVADDSETAGPFSYWSAGYESQTAFAAQLNDSSSAAVSAPEFEKRVETYERAIEEIEQSGEIPARGTRAFG